MSDQRTVRIELGTIPARTGVEATINVDARTGAQLEILHYHCLDCKFRTNLVEEAIEHQKTASAWHKIKGRVKQAFWVPGALNVIGMGMALFLIVEPLIFNLSGIEAAVDSAFGGGMAVVQFWLFMRRRELNAKIRESRIAAAGMTR